MATVYNIEIKTVSAFCAYDTDYIKQMFEKFLEDYQDETTGLRFESTRVDVKVYDHSSPANSYVGKECVYVDTRPDKAKLNNNRDGQSLGVCIGNGRYDNMIEPIVWFEKPFLNFYWQFKSNVRLKDE